MDIVSWLLVLGAPLSVLVICVSAAWLEFSRQRRDMRRAEAGRFLEGRYDPPFPLAPGSVPGESELLVAITERFFGSAAFKALGLALVAAVLLAGAGSLMLGGQTLNLREQLSEVAQVQRTTLEQAGKTQLEALATLGRDIETSRSELKKKTEEMNANVETSTSEVRRQVDQFKTDLKDLQDKAINTIVADLQRDLATRSGDLSKKLEETAAGERGALSSRIATLSGQVDAIQGEITPLIASVRDLNVREAALKDQMGRLDGVAAEANGFRNIARTSADRATESAAEAKASAGGASAAAGEAKNAAVQAGEAVRSIAAPRPGAASDAGGSRNSNELADLPTKLSDLERRLAAFENDKAALLSRMNDHEARLRSIEKPGERVPASERELSPEGRRRIQEALATLNLDPGANDGIFGRKTRIAIRRYQVSLGVSPTQQLTADQIARLWAKASASPPAPRAGPGP